MKIYDLQTQLLWNLSLNYPNPFSFADCSIIKAIRYTAIPSTAAIVLSMYNFVFSAVAYLKCRPAENAMLKLLNRKRVMNICWKKNLLILAKIGNLSAKSINIVAMTNSATNKINIMFMFDKNEALYPIACTLLGTSCAL